MDWEMIDGYHFRLKVPGGWIFKVVEDVVQNHPNQGFTPGWDFRIAICFIPDPDHLWIVEKK